MVCLKKGKGVMTVSNHQKHQLTSNNDMICYIGSNEVQKSKPKVLSNLLAQRELLSYVFKDMYVESKDRDLNFMSVQHTNAFPYLRELMKKTYIFNPIFILFEWIPQQYQNKKETTSENVTTRKLLYYNDKFNKIHIYIAICLSGCLLFFSFLFIFLGIKKYCFTPLSEILQEFSGIAMASITGIL